MTYTHLKGDITLIQEEIRKIASYSESFGFSAFHVLRNISDSLVENGRPKNAEPCSETFLATLFHILEVDFDNSDFLKQELSVMMNDKCEFDFKKAMTVLRRKLVEIEDELQGLFL